MNIAILGFGSQGASSLEYWQKPENSITVCDRDENLDLPDGIAAQLGAGYLKGLDRFDLIVRSPSIYPADITKANPESPAILNKVTSNTNEFMEVCPTRNIIGVTGTKGKGTTSTLITKMLEAVGHRVHLGGNIGTPPLEMLKADIQPDDWVVLELANFQLIDIKHSPRIAVCLMVVSEHMDWHPNLDDYLMAKQQLFRWQADDDVAVYFADNALSTQTVSVSKGKKIPYFREPGAMVQNERVVIEGQVICGVDEIKLLGKHNWQNVCAAVTAVWQITQDVKAIRHTVQSVTGLPFRLEFVRELGGVKYYNDSFGTTPETAVVAVQAFEQPKILIAGGSDKGASYKELARTITANNVKHVIAIGVTGRTIADELRALGYTSIIDNEITMPGIVARAHHLASDGDIVLLSTGSASFGLFKNYKDRGEQFNQAVRSLA
jgi:UDP-N-acetylmuramoylalanine--D-glutamate ligase